MFLELLNVARSKKTLSFASSKQGQCRESRQKYALDSWATKGFTNFTQVLKTRDFLWAAEGIHS